MLQNQDFSYLYTEEERARFDWCRREQGSWNYRPLISIVVPVYKTPVRLLNEMIGSVVRQSYPQWELCIANASPEDGKLREALAAWQREDGRIHVQELAENGGISANTNACFAMVQGEYTAMLDHDDMLTENALAEVVWLLQKQPETDFLYSDQDMLEEDSSKRFNPLYKPQWSKDCMYSGNYITHFSVLRTSLIREIGGWDPSTDGAQDWDLFLKAAEAYGSDRGDSAYSVSLADGQHFYRLFHGYQDLCPGGAVRPYSGALAPGWRTPGGCRVLQPGYFQNTGEVEPYSRQGYFRHFPG